MAEILNFAFCQYFMRNNLHYDEMFPVISMMNKREYREINDVYTLLKMRDTVPSICLINTNK